MFDTCPYCDSFDLRVTPSLLRDGADAYFCRGCGEAWVENEQFYSTLWKPDSESVLDDPNTTG